MTGAPDNPPEMHFSIRYQTTYAYDAEVVDNVNALRVKPATNSRQQVEEFSVRVTPDVRLHRHEDYFGTEVVEFEITRPHREMAIDVRARVTTQGQAEPYGTAWEGLARGSYLAAAGEFLLQTDDAPGHPLLTALHGSVAEAPTPLAAALLVSELIPDRFEYRPGATYVDSPLTDALDGAAGVCQDFSHLGLNLLRHQGIAARYVSGYLYTTNGRRAKPPLISAGKYARSFSGEAAQGADAQLGPDGASEYAPSVEVETHAWIEALLPGDNGNTFWLGIDPTNRGLTGECHVKIGHGRHYADVPPIKGVYRGTARSQLEARVTMTPADGPDPLAAARG